MGRPKTGEKSRRQVLLDTALELFRAHGFHRVSVEEICTKADVSKVTFYKNFTNKTQILLGVLDGVREELQAEYLAIARSDVPFPRKLERLTALGAERSRGLGEAFLKDLLDRPDPAVV